MYGRRAGNLLGEQGPFVGGKFGYRARTHLPLFDAVFDQGATTLADAVSAGASITLTRASSNATHFDSSGVLQTAGTNVARFDHDSSGTALGLLIEGARTTRVLRSEEIDNASWSKVDITITANDRSAPDGETTADLITEGTAGSAQTNQNYTATANASQAVTLVLNASANNDWVRVVCLEPAASTNRVTGWFNLTTGAAGTASNGGTGSDAATAIEDWGSGWHRCILIGAVNNSATALNTALISADADAGTSRVNSAAYHGWGAMIEDNTSFPSSYIKTEGSTAERAADVASASISAGDVVTQVIKARTAPGVDSVSQVVSQWDDGTEDERIRVERNSSSEIHVIVTTGGSGVADLNLGTVADSTSFKVALRATANDFSASLDGGAVVMDTNGALPSGLDTKRFGRDTAGEEWFGHLQRDTIYPVGLPDSQLRVLAA